MFVIFCTGSMLDSVRARAIAAFGHCLTSGSAEILSAVQEIVTPKPVVPNAAFRQIPTPEIARSQQLTGESHWLILFCSRDSTNAQPIFTS